MRNDIKWEEDTYFYSYVSYISSSAVVGWLADCLFIATSYVEESPSDITIHAIFDSLSLPHCEGEVRLHS